MIPPLPIYKAVTEFQDVCGPSHSFVVGERGLEYLIKFLLTYFNEISFFFAAVGAAMIKYELRFQADIMFTFEKNERRQSIF